MKSASPQYNPEARAGFYSQPQSVQRKLSFEDGEQFESAPVADSIVGLTHPNLFSPTSPEAFDPALTRATLSELLASQNHLAILYYTHSTILTTNPQHTVLLLQLWLNRLQSLFLISPGNFITELSAIFSLFPPTPYLRTNISPASKLTRFGNQLIPFEFYVLRARVDGLRGDEDRGIEELSSLIRACRGELGRTEAEVERNLWKGRITSVGEILIESLARIKANDSAISLLKSSSPSITTSKNLINLHYTTGNLIALELALSELSNLEISKIDLEKLQTLNSIGRGDWNIAEEKYREILKNDPNDLEVGNNLAVCLLFTCKLQEGIELLNGRVDEVGKKNFTTLSELRVVREIVSS